MRLLRLGLLAGAGALIYQGWRRRRGELVPRFQFLDPHTAGFTHLRGGTVEDGSEGSAQRSHPSAASAANDPGGYRDDRDVVGSGLLSPSDFNTEEH
jgi:hypothetical protein